MGTHFKTWKIVVSSSGRDQSINANAQANIVEQTGHYHSLKILSKSTNPIFEHRLAVNKCFEMSAKRAKQSWKIKTHHIEVFHAVRGEFLMARILRLVLCSSRFARFSLTCCPDLIHYDGQGQRWFGHWAKVGHWRRESWGEPRHRHILGRNIVSKERGACLDWDELNCCNDHSEIDRVQLDHKSSREFLERTRENLTRLHHEFPKRFESDRPLLKIWNKVKRFSM